MIFLVGGGVIAIAIAALSGAVIGGAGLFSESGLVAMILAAVIGMFAGWLAWRMFGVLLGEVGEVTGALLAGQPMEIPDDLGDLGDDLRRFQASRDEASGRMERSREALRGVIETLEARARSMNRSVGEEGTVLDDAYGSIETLSSGVRRVSEAVETLSASSEETSSSILEMVASLEEVTRHTDALFSSVEETASATNQMVSSIREVDQNVDYLQNFVTDTSTSMVQMSTSINQVEQNAGKSYELALAAADAAESGMRAVRETIDGMEQIRRAVAESNAVVSKLGDRSTEIGKILGVIEDVAEQTNLLALNASILAVQAGEYGKGFSVVAGQIRDLSERTANSTREIGLLIKSVQEEVANALETMSRGAGIVESGVNLSHEAGEALNKILDSAQSSAGMVREIADAMQEQARGSSGITESIDKLREMVRQINSATSQQTQGSTQILQAVESMRDLTQHVRQATSEQKSGSEMISRAAEQMIEQTHAIFQVAATQGEESENILGTMERLRDVAERNRGWASELEGSIQRLAGELRTIEDEITRMGGA